MKTIIYSLGITIMAFMMSCGNSASIEETTTTTETIDVAEENSDVPKAVQDAFKSAYPEATDVEWEKEDDGYEVEFELEDNEHEAEYDANGNLLAFETALSDVTQLPEGVITYIEENYPNAEIEEAEKVEITGKGIFYEVEIEEENGADADQNNDDEGDDDENEIVMEIIFDADGNFIELEEDDEDDEDEDEVDEEHHHGDGDHDHEH